MKRSFLLPIFCLLLAITITTGCKPDNPIFGSNALVFKSELFRDQLIQRLGTAVGYQFVITQDGRIVHAVANGNAAVNTAGDTLRANVNLFFNIASMTKTMTAAAALTILAENDILPTASIGPYLPASWQTHPQIANLNFRQLLAHLSGIRESATDYNSLKVVVASPPNANRNYFYANANYALFRVLLPKITNPVEFEQRESQMSTTEFEQWVSEEYIRIMNQYVFAKVGIPFRACTPIAGQTVNGHGEIFREAISQSLGVWTNISGGGGFYLTTIDLARIMVFMRYREDIISNETRNYMDNNNNTIGWNRRMNVRDGSAIGHGGSLYLDLDGSESLTGNDVGVEGIIVKFPNKVELALTINSVGADWRPFNSMLIAAYNASFEKP